MKKNLVWIAGIVGSLVLGCLIAIAGSHNGATWNGFPVFALLCATAFVIQWLMFVPAFVFQTEKYYDLAGSLTYISLAILAWLLAGGSLYATVIALLVVVWATRLGTYLFIRISGEGEDRRFRSIKPDFLQFLMTWTIQGLWVTVTFSAGLAAMTADSSPGFGLVALIGLLLWIGGFTIEVAADRQKSRFRKENPGEFINVGLWRYSRHPNYFGEIVLWTGIAVLALPVLSGWQFATLISPVFVFVLLNYVSGVRMLEHRADKRWGDDPEYQAYRDSTPVLVPRLFPSSG